MGNSMINDELKELFQEEIKNRIELLKTHIQESDIAQIQHVAHKVKGVGGTFGFDKVTMLGSEIESGAKNNDWSAIKSNYELLVQWYSETMK